MCLKVVHVDVKLINIKLRQFTSSDWMLPQLWVQAIPEMNPWWALLMVTLALVFRWDHWICRCQEIGGCLPRQNPVHQWTRKIQGDLIPVEICCHLPVFGKFFWRLGCYRTVMPASWPHRNVWIHQHPWPDLQQSCVVGRLGISIPLTRGHLSYITGSAWQKGGHVRGKGLTVCPYLIWLVLTWTGVIVCTQTVGWFPAAPASQACRYWYGLRETNCCPAGTPVQLWYWPLRTFIWGYSEGNSNLHVILCEVCQIHNFI